jgi:nucleotide-binding universal stress UspA family protein
MPKEIYMKTILVPLDGSALSEQILPYARLLALSLSARLHLLHIVSEGEKEQALAHEAVLSFEGGGPLPNHRIREQRVFDALCANARSALDALAAPLRAEGFDVIVEMRSGAPAEQIVAVAEEAHSTLIAMATHGYGGLRRWALGSVADKVAHATSIPLLLVRSTAQPRTAHLRRILVPLDGSALSRQALPLATELAMCARAELLLVRGIPTLVEPYIGGGGLPAGAQETLREQASRELSAVARSLHPYQVPVRIATAEGSAAEVILKAAVQRQADLIVMATHGRSGISRWALGSVADKLLHAASTPLLLVRARNEAEHPAEPRD